LIVGLSGFQPTPIQVLAPVGGCSDVSNAPKRAVEATSIRHYFNYLQFLYASFRFESLLERLFRWYSVFNTRVSFRFLTMFMAPISKRQRSGLSIIGNPALRWTLSEPIPEIVFRTFSIRRSAFPQEKQI